MINFTDASMLGAQDKKFENQYNFLVELLSTYLTRGLISSVNGKTYLDLQESEIKITSTIDGETVIITMNPTVGLQITRNGVVVGGISSDGYLTANRIIESGSSPKTYLTIGEQTIDGDTYKGITMFDKGMYASFVDCFNVQAIRTGAYGDSISTYIYGSTTDAFLQLYAIAGVIGAYLYGEDVITIKSDNHSDIEAGTYGLGPDTLVKIRVNPDGNPNFYRWLSGDLIQDTTLALTSDVGCTSDYFTKISEEFDGYSGNYYGRSIPNNFIALGGGTTGNWAIRYTAHPGIAYIKSTTTNPSGGSLYSRNSVGYFFPYEKSTYIFNVQSVAATKVMYLGRHNANAADAMYPTAGYFFYLNNTTLKGCAESLYSTTATSYTMSASTWYKGIIEVNSNMSAVTFSLYNDAGTLLWIDTITIAISTSASVPYFNGKCVSTSGVASDLLIIDYYSYEIPHALAR